MTAMKNALEINNLSACNGGFSLNDVNLSIEKGTVMGLVGKNGAGKTTLIKIILNMLPRTSGEILFDGLPMYGNEKTVKAKIGVVFDSLLFPLSLKPVKIKKMLTPLYPDFDGGLFDSLMERFELDPGKRLAAYSKGMQARFGAVIALSHHPDLILLDEPTAGLDPIARAQLLDLLLEILQDEEKSVLFSTHITSDLDKIADYITMIDHGKILFTQSKEELLDQYVLVSVEKERMTDALRTRFIGGLRETAFSFEGLADGAGELSNLGGVKTARATIEDVMVYLSGKQGRL